MSTPSAGERPHERNGLGLSCDQARQELAELENVVAIICEFPQVYREWKALLADYNITGVHSHDARLVAAVRVYGISRILTFDADDFARYPDIEVVQPSAAA
jgi:predicted nucleic acid-binding protein